MRALRYYGKEDVRLDDIEAPELKPGTVRIKPAFTGICGSDLHLYFDGAFDPAPSTDEPHPISGETLPVVFGHEFSGTVLEVGEGVEGIKEGDKVAVEPMMVCGECNACQDGKYHLCPKMGFIGISGRGGGLAEEIVVEERWVHQIGDLSLEEGALVEPLAVAVHAVNLTSAEEGQTAVVGGAGPIGLLTAAALKAKGLKVIVSEVSDARKKIAKETGVADLVVDPSEQDLPEVVKGETDGYGADVAFDCAGIAPVVEGLMQSLHPGGELMVVAIHTKPMEFELWDQFNLTEISMRGAVAYANNHPEAIELASSGKVDLTKFISRKIKVDDIVEDGFKRLRERGETEVKILVEM